MTKEISLDIDGVCAMTNEEMARIISDELGSPFTIEDITDWNLKLLLIRDWGFSERDASRFAALYIDPEFFKKLQPYPEAQAAVEYLSAMGYLVSFNTARSVHCKDITIEWVEEHFPAIEDRVNVLDSKQKVGKIIESGAILHLDDYDATVEEINQNGKSIAKLLPRPWNRTNRVPVEDESSWTEFLVLAQLAR